MSRIRLVEPMNLLQEDPARDMRRALDAAAVAASNDGGRFRLTEDRRGTPFLTIGVDPLDGTGNVRTDGLHASVRIGDPAEPVLDRWYGSANALEETIAFAIDALEGAVPVEAQPALDEADLVVLGLVWRLLDGPGDAMAVVRRATPWSGVSIVHRPLGDPEPSAVLGVPPRRLVDWRLHPPADAVEAEALAAIRHGTLVRAHHRRPELLPATFSASTETADPVTRMRALAAWAEYREARA